MELSTPCHPALMLDAPQRSSRAVSLSVDLDASRLVEPGRQLTSRPAGIYAAIKPGAEYVLAILLFVVLSPVIAAAALMTRLTSRGPAFYRQTRVGKHGREFRLWKIRSMVPDAEASTGPVWSVGQDPRVTPLGRFLRASHIDEFPQLLNVLAGDMSLVGPRPERPEFVGYLEWQVPGYRHRLDVRPGITGLAQVCLPPDTDIESVRKKLVHDLYYVEQYSLWLDLKILMHTGLGLGRVFLSALAAPLRLPAAEVDCCRWNDGEIDGRSQRGRQGRTAGPATSGGL